MPLVSFPIAGIALGAGLYWANSKSLPSSIQPLSASALLILAVVGGLAFAPCVTFVVALAPAWAAGYWFDPGALPMWALPLWSLFNAAMLPVGFALCSFPRREGSKQSHRVWTLASGLVALAPLVLFGSRTAAYASFAQFRGDYAIQRVASAPLGQALVMCVLGLACAVWWARRCLRFLGEGGAHGV